MQQPDSSLVHKRQKAIAPGQGKAIAHINPIDTGVIHSMIAQLTAQAELNAYIADQAQAIAPETKIPTAQLCKGDYIQHFAGTWLVLTTPKPAPGGLEFDIEWVNLPPNHSPQTVRFAPEWKFGYLGKAA